MRRDEDPAGLPPPHERAWVHPSEIESAAPPMPAHPPMSPADANGAGRGVVDRLRRLPLGTAAIAGAAGAVAMFGAMAVIGPSVQSGSVEPVETPSRPVTTASRSLSAGGEDTGRESERFGFAATPAEVPPPYAPAVVISAGSTDALGVVLDSRTVIAAAGASVAATWAQAQAVTLRTGDGEATMAATVRFDPATSLVTLDVPGLEFQPPERASSLAVGQVLWPASSDGVSPAPAGSVAALANPYRLEPGCLAVVSSTATTAGGPVLVDERGRVAMILIPDARPDDTLAEGIRLDLAATGC